MTVFLMEQKSNSLLPSAVKSLQAPDDLRLSPYIIRSQDGFLRGDPNHVEDGAGDVFADTAIRVGTAPFSFPDRKEEFHTIAPP